MYCLADKAEMLFPNAFYQKPASIAAGDNPPENPAVVDDVPITSEENDDYFIDGRFIST